MTRPTLANIIGTCQRLGHVTTSVKMTGRKSVIDRLVAEGVRLGLLTLDLDENNNIIARRIEVYSVKKLPSKRTKKS